MHVLGEACVEGPVVDSTMLGQESGTKTADKVQCDLESWVSQID